MNGMTVTALALAVLFAGLWRRTARSLRCERVTETARYARLAVMYLKCRNQLGMKSTELAQVKRELQRATSSSTEAQR